MDRSERVAVVGAGLGGLTVAGFLQRVGFTVRVFEQAPAFSRIGAGIILSANSTKVLRRLGLEDRLIAAGIKSQQYISRAWDWSTASPPAPSPSIINWSASTRRAMRSALPSPTARRREPTSSLAPTASARRCANS